MANMNTVASVRALATDGLLKLWNRGGLIKRLFAKLQAYLGTPIKETAALVAYPGFVVFKTYSSLRMLFKKKDTELLVETRDKNEFRTRKKEGSKDITDLNKANI